MARADRTAERLADVEVPAQRSPGRTRVSVLVYGTTAVAQRVGLALADTDADVRCASGTADLLRAPRPTGSGLVVIAASLPSQAMCSLLPVLQQRGWHRIVLLCHSRSDHTVQIALARGVRCLVHRTDPPPPPARADPLQEVSAREAQVLQAVADGLTTQEVAWRLALSELTVKSHLSRVARKAGTGDRAHLVALAMRAGLVR